MTQYIRCSLCTLLGVLFMAGGNLAAQASQDSTGSSADVNTKTAYADQLNLLKRTDLHQPELQEVIVTAQYHRERLLETPLSMSVVSATDLNKLGAVDFRDWASAVPGLTFTTSGTGATQVTLRGLSTGTDIGSTVGTYLDDVPIGSATFQGGSELLAFDESLFDVERIEVLRGPQGTLYGASTLGGLINYVTKLPDTASFDAEIQSGVSGTNDGGTNYSDGIAVNSPILSHHAAVRASAFYYHDSGFIDNVALNEKGINRFSKYGGRVDLLLKPTDGLTIRIGGFLQDIFRDGNDTALYTPTGVPIYGRLDDYHAFDTPFNQQFRLGNATVTYSFGAATLTSISSYQTINSLLTYDTTSSQAPLFAKLLGVTYGAIGEIVPYTTHRFTQEVRLVSNGKKRLSWVVGGYYTNEASEYGLSLSTLNVARQPVPNDILMETTPSHYREVAGYGDLTYMLSRKFDLTGGIRYASQYSTFEQFASGLFAGKPQPPARATESVFTYLANARYHFSDQSMGYLRYATGYRPGGGNALFVNPRTGLPLIPPTYGSDKVQSYEVGYKTHILDHRLGIDASAYYIDWTDIQIDAVSPSGLSYVGNASGGATSQGVELTLDAHPTEALTMSGSFDYQDPYLRQAEPSLGKTARAGARLPNVPRFTAALIGNYEVQDLTLRPTFGVTLRYVDARVGTFSNPRYQLPPYTTVDLSAGVTLESVALQLYVHNVCNKLAEYSGMITGGISEVSLMGPRTIGITATAHF